MNFKAPRDPNTPTMIKILRTYSPDENFPCHVGSGECSEPAVQAHDDGAGGEFLVCAKHLPEVEAFAKLVNEMSKAQLQNISNEVKNLT